MIAVIIQAKLYIVVFPSFLAHNIDQYPTISMQGVNNCVHIADRHVRRIGTTGQHTHCPQVSSDFIAPADSRAMKFVKALNYQLSALVTIGPSRKPCPCLSK